MEGFDVAIVGAGIAGASLAAELAPRMHVLLLEAEDAPGYHATGRSAAFWSESYGGPLVQPLTTASGPWLRAPPPRFGSRSFLSARGALHLGRDDDASALADLQAAFAQSGVPLHPVDPATILSGLRREWTRGLLEPSCADIDVARLHAAYLKAARISGAALWTSAAFLSARRFADHWQIETRAGSVTAGLLVNAAGAWADHVAISAGLMPIGITPYRRTIAQLRITPPVEHDLPLIIDVSGGFYFKPEAGGRLWLSPHDETADTAGDVAAEEIDVATAIDRFQSVVDWQVAALEHRWAGLRSFAPDRLPVYGFDAREPRFFWCVGQGGYGIQTAPAAAQLCGHLISPGMTAPPPGVLPVHFDPGRFA